MDLSRTSLLNSQAVPTVLGGIGFPLSGWRGPFSASLLRLAPPGRSRRANRGLHRQHGFGLVKGSAAAFFVGRCCVAAPCQPAAVPAAALSFDLAPHVSVNREGVHTSMLRPGASRFQAPGSRSARTCSRLVVVQARGARARSADSGMHVPYGPGWGRTFECHSRLWSGRCFVLLPNPRLSSAPAVTPLRVCEP